MYKLILVCMIFLVLLSVVPMDSSGHRSGCHRWHSCPSDTGSYECGDMGHDDQCGNNDDSEEENDDDSEQEKDEEKEQ
jgi:hypothetical protein